MLNGFSFSDSQDSSDDDEPPGGYSASGSAYSAGMTDSGAMLFSLEKDMRFSYGSKLPYRTTYDILEEQFRDMLNM